MTPSNTQAIKKKVMLASLQISAWTGRAFDNRATATVEESYLHKKIGRFNKALMPQKPESFDLILKAGTRLRRYFTEHTLDYQQLGVRLMTTDIYLDFMKHLRKEIQDHQILVDDFLGEYDSIKRTSQSRLGDLYNEEDYPDKEVLASKFEIKFSVLPFPDASQFDLDLPDADLLVVKEDLDNNIQEAVNFARSDLSKRLYEATLKLAQRASSDGKFHSAAIQNLREIIEILPKLNFMNDQGLTELANQAGRELTAFDADVLRTSPRIRNDIANKATSIAHTMSSYFDMPFDNSLLDLDEPDLSIKKAA